MQFSGFQQRHTWSILGTALVLAAFITIIAAVFHIDGLPSQPFACDEFECADPIYDLRAPYGAVTGSAFLAGTTGFLLLTLGRPIHSTRFTQRPCGWSRVGINSLLAVGVSFGVLFPWWALTQMPWTVPRLTLVITLGLTLVHFTVWYWLRRQHGKDRDAWATALIIQAAASFLTVAISVPLFFFAPWLALVAQPIFLLIGAKLGALPPKEEPEHPSAERDTVVSTPRLIATAAGGVVIAITTTWAALPRPIPQDLQPRVEAGDWPIQQDPDPPPPVESPRSPTPSRTPATEPTRQAPACTAAAVDVTIDGWDAATGARAAALVVTTEHTSQACQLQGIPEFRILQAGEDLNVTVSEYGLSSETQDVYENITVGPGESAEATLHWRGERSAYHDDSAQQAEIRIDNTWIEAEFEFHQSAIPRSSPFDLIKHSELKISEWTPGS